MMVEIHLMQGRLTKERVVESMLENFLREHVERV